MKTEIQRINLPSIGGFQPPALALAHLAWLKRESDRHNLTRVPEKDWPVRHVMDSLVPAFAGWEIGESFLDLGSGGGFPGVPLAAWFPKARFTLLEKKKKTARILNEFLCESGVEDRGRASSQRAEASAHDALHRAVYDQVVARAVSSLPVLIELGIPFLKVGGELWVWKSDLGELDGAAKALDELRSRPTRALRYRLFGEETDRILISVRKEGETPNKYPRREGIPEKRPI